MLKYDYQVNDELRVLESPDGYRQVGLRRSVSAPSEALQNHVKAVKEFRDGIVALEGFSMKEFDQQEEEIAALIGHKEFFLDEFRHNQWSSNPMLDRQRIRYSDQIDSLRRERRGLRLKRIDALKSFKKELLEADKELSPFGRFF